MKKNRVINLFLAVFGIGIVIAMLDWWVGTTWPDSYLSQVLSFVAQPFLG